VRLADLDAAAQQVDVAAGFAQDAPRDVPTSGAGDVPCRVVLGQARLWPPGVAAGLVERLRDQRVERAERVVVARVARQRGERRACRGASRA